MTPLSALSKVGVLRDVFLTKKRPENQRYPDRNGVTGIVFQLAKQFLFGSIPEKIGSMIKREEKTTAAVPPHARLKYEPRSDAFVH
jgi:hypothetical protein